MSQTFSVSWQNANSMRAYPLSSWATRIDTTGQITLPNSFILGLRLAIANTSLSPGQFFVSAVDVTPPLGYAISISYHSDSGDTLVAVASIPGDHEEGASYFIQGQGSFSGAVGNVTIGQLVDMEVLPPGTYAFDYAAGVLEVDAIIPQISGVTSITVVNGLERSQQFSGDIEIVAANNMRITPSLETNLTRLIFSAVSGAGLNQSCDCEEDFGEPVRSLNGVFGDTSRNISLLNGPCMEITQVANGLKIKNTCSTPCCTCRELDKIWENLDRFSDGAATLKGLAVSLSSEIRVLSANMLTSTLVR